MRGLTNVWMLGVINIKMVLRAKTELYKRYCGQEIELRARNSF